MQTLNSKSRSRNGNLSKVSTHRPAQFVHSSACCCSSRTVEDFENGGDKLPLSLRDMEARSDSPLAEQDTRTSH